MRTFRSLSLKYKEMTPRYLDFILNADGLTVRKLLSSARVMLLPSKYEALPYAVLEALSSGTPVVVSKAIPEELVAENINGFRISSFEPYDYANKLLLLFNDSALWKKMSFHAIKTAKKYSHINIAKQYENVIRHF